MQTTNIGQEIRSFLVENFLFGRNEELHDDAPLLDKVIDSHGVMELVVFLQDRFAIKVEDDEVTTDNLNSVNKAVAYVARKLGSKA